MSNIPLLLNLCIVRLYVTTLWADFFNAFGYIGYICVQTIPKENTL